MAGSILDWAQQQKAALGGGAAGPAAPAGAAPPPGAPPPASAPPDPYSTTNPTNGTGTTQGPNVLGPQVGGAVSSIPIIGPTLGGLTSPTQVDTSGLQKQLQISDQLSKSFGGERSAIGTPTLNQDPANQTRGQQEQAIAALTAAANGTAPSAAELMAEKARQANVANQMGIAAASRGHSAGGALYNAAEGTANINSAAAGNAEINRASEQATARGQLVTALGGQRSQDIDQAAKAAGLTNEQYLALLNAQVSALNGGTSAAGAAATASAANAAAANKMKGGFLDAAGSVIGV